MASLRLTFPDKDQPTVIALTGARLTIGRLPLNTIQIIDRTVSGFHAELVSEHGHYRLHDRGSTNGTFVNGQKIADFHLNEACTITLGSVEAQFSPEPIPAGEEAETFPSRGEVNAVRKENAELRATVEALREEVAALQKAKPMEGDASLAVPKADYDQIVVEREALKEAQLRQNEEMDRLKTDLAVLRRDRSNLQLAFDGVQAELDEVRRKIGSVEGAALAPAAAATALAAQAPEEPVIEKEPEPSEPSVAEAAPIEPPEAPVEAPEKKAPERPAPKPFAPLAPKLPGAAPAPKAAPPSLPAKPASLPPKPAALPPKPASPAPAPVPVAAKAPSGLGSGVRPMAKPPIAPTGETSESLPNVPTTKLSSRPLPTAKLPMQPTIKLAATPLPKVGPKGTQKLSGDAKPGAPKP